MVDFLTFVKTIDNRCSIIYVQTLVLKYGVQGRLAKSCHSPCILEAYCPLQLFTLNTSPICCKELASLVPRPFPPPIFDHLQHALFYILQAIKNWRREGLGTRIAKTCVITITKHYYLPSYLSANKNVYIPNSNITIQSTRRDTLN